MTISDYLANLVKLRDSLKASLAAKGVDVEDKNTMFDLVPMVENISDISEAPIEKALYRFGVLSDIHLKNEAYVVADDTDPDAILDATKSLSDYQRALTFYKNNGVDFLCINGDIVANSRNANETADEETREIAMHEWLSEIQLFAHYNSEYFPDKPIYATTGNHDANPYGFSNGKSSTAPYNLGMTIPIYGDGTKTAEEVWTEIVDRNPRFVIEQGNDVFIFLPMYYYNYVTFFKDGDKAWLETELGSHKNKRVFLFFHPMVSGTYDIDGNGINHTETRGDVQDFINMMNNNPNVIWFTGHSHYNLWREGKVQPDGVTPYVNPNTYQSGDSMIMVHCPSCAYIRNKTASGSVSRDNDGSQGLLVDVFADRVVIKGVDFAQGDGGMFIPKATYVINTK